MADTGAGASIVLTTTGAVGLVKSLQLPEFSIDALNVDALSSTLWMPKTKTDLADAGEISVEVYFDGDSVVPVLGVHQTVTVTMPKISASTSVAAATLAATGFISSVQLPEVQVGELMMATITITLDGGYNSGTVPTWTKEA